MQRPSGKGPGHVCFRAGEWSDVDQACVRPRGPGPIKTGVREARGRPTCPHAPWEPMCFLEGGMGRGGVVLSGRQQAALTFIKHQVYAGPQGCEPQDRATSLEELGVSMKSNASSTSRPDVPSSRTPPAHLLKTPGWRHCRVSGFQESKADP